MMTVTAVGKEEFRHNLERNQCDKNGNGWGVENIVEETTTALFAVEDDAISVIEKEVLPPDGGLHAWLVVVGTFLVHLTVDGTLSSFGVFLATYSTPSLTIGTSFATTSATVLSLIGSFAAGCTEIFGILTGRLAESRVGYRAMMMLGTVVLTVALILASFSTQAWQLILTQGFLFGLGASMCFAPSLAVPSHWFSRRLGLAAGFAVAGSGIGGLAFSPLIQTLINRFGVAWALRVIAAVLFVLNSVASYLCKARLPRRQRASERFNWKPLKSKEFLAIATMFEFTSLSHLIPYFLMPCTPLVQNTIEI